MCYVFICRLLNSLLCAHIRFSKAMDTVVIKTLAAGEEILVDGDAILAFEGSVKIDVRYVGNVAACCCGGEGVFNTLMQGPGKIWLQSMGIDKMRKLFPPTVVSANDGGSGNSDGDNSGQ